MSGDGKDKMIPPVWVKDFIVPRTGQINEDWVSGDTVWLLDVIAGDRGAGQFPAALGGARGEDTSDCGADDRSGRAGEAAEGDRCRSMRRACRMSEEVKIDGTGRFRRALKKDETEGRSMVAQADSGCGAKASIMVELSRAGRVGRAVTCAGENCDIDMVDQVWISEVLSNSELGNKLGLRHKWFGEPWEAPYVNHYIPRRSERVKTAINKHYAGHTMRRENMPEASAVYSMPHFRRAKDVFFAGGFLAVKGRVAEVLSRFDFGAGGGLVPYTIYEADEKTPLPGPFYIVNFGPFKDCFLPDASTNIRKSSVHYQTGRKRWDVSYVKDGDVAVSPASLAGADLWMCPGIEGCIFMSNRVVEALKTALSDAGFGEFTLHRCRIVG